jgi:hypothetical protein
MSTCAVLGATLDAAETLGQFNGGAAGQAHGPVHMFTGGQAGTPGLVAKMAAIGFTASSKIHNQVWGSGVTFFFQNVKSLWRYGLWTCPESCDAATTAQEDCSCGCDAAEVLGNADVMADLLQPYADAFESQGVTLPGSSAVDGQESLALLVDLMCSFSSTDAAATAAGATTLTAAGSKGSKARDLAVGSGLVMGDHASAGAAVDPSFWVIHGTVERWLQVVRLGKRFSSEDWKTPVFASNVHPFQDSCSGHGEDDALVFGAVDGMSFTNGQYYAYLDPSSSSLPYVYDNFKWDHCLDLGVDIASGGTTATAEATAVLSSKGYPVPLTSGM